MLSRRATVVSHFICLSVLAAAAALLFLLVVLGHLVDRQVSFRRNNISLQFCSAGLLAAAFNVSWRLQVADSLCFLSLCTDRPACPGVTAHEVGRPGVSILPFGWCVAVVSQSV